MKNILFHLGNPKEYILANGVMLVDCPQAEIIHVFNDDREVVNMGHLRVTFLPNLKIQVWEFHTKKHQELIPRSLLLNARANQEGDALTEPVEVILQPSPLNEFGTTVAAMRCLEVNPLPQSEPTFSFHLFFFFPLLLLSFLGDWRGGVSHEGSDEFQ